MTTRIWTILFLLSGVSIAQAQSGEPVRLVHDSVAVEFIDADLRGVLQSLARYLPKPLLVSSVPSVRVSLQTPNPVPRSSIGDLIRGVLEAQNLELVEEPSFMRIRERPAPTPAPASTPLAETAQRATHRQDEQRLFVIRLRHARAVDVAATVNQLFGGGGRFSGGNAASTGALSDELRRMNVPPAGGPRPSSTPSGSSTASNPSGAVTIIPDELTNSLLVRATQEDYELVQSAVAELDIRPLQVLIEVLIVEARRDHSFSLGADLFAPEQNVGGGARASGSLTSGATGDLVVTVLNLGGPNVNATLSAAESRGDVAILSRPVLLASNNTEAHLLVGSQRPFVQVSRSLPTDSPSRDQVVEYKDVGTRLSVKPTINHDGYVSLDIDQEVSAATTEVAFDAPVISTREASTRVLLRSGQTVVLGGLKDHQTDHTRHGIPLLSQIPLLGGLFGAVNNDATSTEFYMFLTPRILSTDEDADSVTAPRLPASERP